jgi:hypothetical protein
MRKLTVLQLDNAHGLELSTLGGMEREQPKAAVGMSEVADVVDSQLVWVKVAIATYVSNHVSGRRFNGGRSRQSNEAVLPEDCGESRRRRFYPGESGCVAISDFTATEN